MIHPTRQTTRAGRPSFTLIELLVVIAIIAVLIGLTTAAVMAVLTTQTKTATKTTLNKLAGVLKTQWQAAVDQANDEFRAFNANNPDPNIAAAFAASGGNNPDTAKRLWVSLRLQQEFPTSFAEAGNPVTYTANGATVVLPSKYAKAIAGLNSAGQPATWESSVCLYLALTKARRGQGDALTLESAVGAGSIQSQNVSGLPVKVLVDNYGTPIAFTRGLGLDPNDPTKFVPQVISAGPDKVPGNADDIVSQPQFQ
jgi:prepilin-type N-terminal cleavage/methylation domain-containing protein